MLLEVVAQGLAHGGLHHAHHLVVAQLGLGLTLELRLGHLDRDHGRQTVAEVLFRQLDLHLGQLLEQLVVFGIFLERERQAAAEAGEVRASLDGVDVVDIRVDVLVIVGVVGQRHLDGDAVLLRVEMDDVFDQRLLAGVDVFDELLEALVAVIHLAAGIALLVAVAHIGERQRDAGVEKRQVAQTVGQSLVVVYGLAEYRRVRMEEDSRARVVGLAYHLQAACRLAVGIFLHVDLAVAVDLGAQIVRQGVDAAHADTVETSRHLV